MQRKSVVLLLTVFLCGLGLLLAHDAKKKSLDANTKIVQLISKKQSERFQMTTLKTDETSVTISSPKTRANLTTAAVDVLFSDNFEGGTAAWEPSASWGNRATPAGGRLDENQSDWEYVDNNSNSPTHSWHETGATALDTDLLISPSFTLPTTLGDGSPLARVTMSFAVDWDAVARSQVRILFGSDEVLWHFDGSAPGTGASSWVMSSPATAPYDQFLRQSLTTPTIDLTSATAPVNLSFQYKSISEPEFDYNKVDVFTNADNYTTYNTVFSHAGGTGTGGVPDWTTATVDLSSYVGSVVKLRFGHFGDFGFVEPNNIFALDAISVSHAGGSLFSDDGGESGTSSMTTFGFAPSAPVAAFTGVANPAPNWLTVNVPVNLLAAGGGGTLTPGMDVRVAFQFANLGTVPGGRGLYVDDVNINGEAIANDVSAANVGVPFPARVGNAVTFTLNVTNNGSAPQSNVQWQGSIFNNATGAQVASVVGRGTATLASGQSEAIPSTNTWTPAAAGVYRIRAFTRLANDEDRTNDTTAVATDDPNGFGGGDARYSPFVVHDGNVLFSSALWNAPASATPSQLLTRGFRVNTDRSEPGVVTWQTTASALVPFVNLGVNYTGAYVQFDSLGRSQDEDLIIPNLDFSAITSDAFLTFKALGVGGFGYTRFSVSVSNNGGATWNDVPGSERRRGIDPQTGQNFGGPAFFTANMRPAVQNITRLAAGSPNVWIRFRYEGENDADWTIWNVAVSGKGLQAANLVSVLDIAPDQGKQVRVTWDRSANDGSLAGVPITEYGVWRREKPPAANGVVAPEPDAIVVADRQAMIANIAGLKPGTRFYEASTAAHWDFLGNVIARSEARYGFVAPTLVDSLVYQFMVSAHTANPLVFGNSNIVEAFSVDNLAPNAPLLSGGAQSGFVQLNWTEPDNEEARFYSIYRRLMSEPSFGNPIGTSATLEFQDTNIQKSTAYVYVVTASDYANNESQFSNKLEVTTTAVAGQGVELPTSYALNNNYPNPFNPTTMISYQIPKAGEVTLTIINSLGQKVRTLVAGQVAAGYHQMMWDARDDNGNLVGSGTYLYRIEAGNFVQTKKLVLMK